MQRLQRRSAGFTMVELLIVIVILGILSAIVVFAVGNSTGNAATQACKTEARQFFNGYVAYQANHGGDARDGRDHCGQGGHSRRRPRSRKRHADVPLAGAGQAGTVATATSPQWTFEHCSGSSRSRELVDMNVENGPAAGRTGFALVEAAARGHGRGDCRGARRSWLMFPASEESHARCVPKPKLDAFTGRPCRTTRSRHVDKQHPQKARCRPITSAITAQPEGASSVRVDVSLVVRHRSRNIQVRRRNEHRPVTATRAAGPTTSRMVRSTRRDVRRLSARWHLRRREPASAS